MRVLIDTNIFIFREDAHALSDDLQQLLNVLYGIKAELLVHPLSVEEVANDKDKARRTIMLSKIRAYPQLAKPPNPYLDDRYVTIIKPTNNAHDIIDDYILYAVFKDAVDFLITEDRDIHRKATQLGIDNRVLLITEALSFFNAHSQKDSFVIPPALESSQVYNLDIRDPIFDSLKNSYFEFITWFTSVSREGRKCLVHYNDDKTIGALLIYKLEDEPIPSSVPQPKEKRLKISLFKVTRQGYKIGELFIKLSIDIAIENNCAEIYLTHFIEEEDKLVDLILEYGFSQYGSNARGEGIFIKKLYMPAGEAEHLSPFDITKKYYPSFYDGQKVSKFIIPIRPQYHSRLFTNYKGRQLTLSESAYFIVEGNTIKKAYISHSRISKIKQGDIILFYVSQRKQLITIGIVESVYTGLTDYLDIARLVGKRTVYTVNEIESIAKKPSMAIFFWQYFHFAEPLTLSQLKNMGILINAPMSIRTLSEKSYKKIKEAGSIDKRFIIN